MTYRCGAALMVLFCGSTVVHAQARAMRLEKKDLGKVPAGWFVARTGKGEGSVWQVVADATAPSKSGLALAQTAKSPGSLFNLCVLDKSDARDADIRVAFKAIEGKLDQGGGLVWRYQDANNYYLARMNPLEDNYRLYKVVAGKRIQLASKEGLRVPVGEWHTLKIRHQGKRIECFFDERSYLAINDDTFTRAGKVGVWTKADAQTYFDGLLIHELSK